MVNLWIATAGRCMPSDRACPDADINYRYTFDEIVAEVGMKAEAEAMKRKK